MVRQVNNMKVSAGVFSVLFSLVGKQCRADVAGGSDKDTGSVAPPTTQNPGTSLACTLYTTNSISLHNTYIRDKNCNILGKYSCVAGVQ